MPYCVAGTTDAKAAGIITRAYKKMNAQAPAVFTLRELERFTTFVRELPMPTSEVDMETEALNAQSQSLVLLPRERDILIDREPFPSRNGVQREMIPLGGLKVWSTAQIPWVSLLRELEHFDRELEDAPGGDAFSMVLPQQGVRPNCILRYKFPSECLT